MLVFTLFSVPYQVSKTKNTYGHKIQSATSSIEESIKPAPHLMKSDLGNNNKKKIKYIIIYTIFVWSKLIPKVPILRKREVFSF